MSSQRMTVAQLNDEQLARIKDFEDEAGYLLVALEPKFALARLRPEQLRRLQDLESELGVVLLAYDNS
jgi:hypothetical protein